jgi:hypothetical protein
LQLIEDGNAIVESISEDGADHNTKSPSAGLCRYDLAVFKNWQIFRFLKIQVFERR